VNGLTYAGRSAWRSGLSESRCFTSSKRIGVVVGISVGNCAESFRGGFTTLPGSVTTLGCSSILKTFGLLNRDDPPLDEQFIGDEKLQPVLAG
jgi:hypothetical protein